MPLFFQPITSLLPSESPLLSDSQNRRIFVIVGSIGGSVIVLLLTAIIILQCVTLLSKKRECTESKINFIVKCSQCKIV